MTLQQLEYIVALDTYRHYVTAAQRSFVSQPNLTMQIKKLEEELGLKIFDREKKPIQPTEIGEEVIRRAKGILLEVGQLKEYVTTEKESLEGEFHVGVIPTLAPYLLPLFLPNFVKHNPKTRLKIQELQTEQIIDQLRKGALDIGLLVTPLDENSIREIPLFYEPFLLYAPQDHPLFLQSEILPESLDPKQILVLDEGHCFREQALVICKNKANRTNMGFDYQSGSIEALKMFVKSGIGYTLVPELSVNPKIDKMNVRHFSNPEPVREVSIVVHNNFIKEVIVNRLQQSILAVIPERFKKVNANKVAVKWK